MNLARPKNDQLMEYLLGLGPQVFTPAQVEAFALTTLAMRPPRVRRVLALLTDQDRLVRLAKGVYITMAEYQRRTREGA